MRNITQKKVTDKFARLANVNIEKNLRPSAGREKQIGEYHFLRVEKLKPYSKQARKSFDKEEMDRLAATIREHGIQQPLTVITTPTPGVYEVVSGERRLRASKVVGLERVPCIILDSHKNAEEIALIENIQRSDLHPIELARALKSMLKDNRHGEQTELANKLGLNASAISELLNFLSIPEHIQNTLIEKSIKTRAILRKLVKASSLNEMEMIVGIKKLETPITRKKSIANIYITSGKIIFEKSFQNLTPQQKSELMKQLDLAISELS